MTPKHVRHARRQLLLLCAAAALFTACKEARPPGTTLALSRAEEITFQLPLPSGQDLSSVVLGANGTLRLADRVQVEKASDSAATPIIANAGAGEVYVDVGADSQLTSDVWALGNVNLRERSTITGSVRTAADIFVQNGVSVGGGLYPHQKLATTLQTWKVTFPASSTDLRVEPDRRASLVPGAYASVSVASRSALWVSSGTYYLDSLEIEDGGTVVLDGTGPFVFYVRSKLELKGPIASPPSSSQPTLLVGFAGSQDVFIRAAFNGTLVAPNSRLTLADIGSNVHRGAFFARDLDVQSSVHIIHAPGALSKVQPVAECVVKSADGSLKAVFGYFSYSLVGQVEIPRGERNSLSSASQSTPPTVFTEGLRHAVFGADFDGRALAWSLDGSTATASAALPACTPGCTDHLESGTPQAPRVLPGQTRFLTEEQSRLMRDTFTWENTTPVPETGPDGNPLLYYATIYLTSADARDALDAFQIHYDQLPLFDEERDGAIPQDETSTDSAEESQLLTFRFDGQGQHVFALVPGAVYNAIRSAALDPVEPAELFPAFIMRPVPPSDAQRTCGLRPLSCVAKKDGAMFAVFGYANTEDGPVTVPRGVRNSLTTTATPLEMFATGVHLAGFALPLSEGQEVSWTLNGQTTSASALSDACPEGLLEGVEPQFRAYPNPHRFDLELCRLTTPQEAQYPDSGLPPAARVDTCQSVNYEYLGKNGFVWRGVGSSQADLAAAAAWSRFDINPEQEVTTAAAVIPTGVAIGNGDVAPIQQALFGKVLRKVARGVAGLGKKIVDKTREGLLQVARLFVGSSLVDLKIDLLNSDIFVTAQQPGAPNVLQRTWGERAGKEISLGGAEVRATRSVFLSKGTLDGRNQATVRILSDTSARICVEMKTYAAEVVHSWFLPSVICARPKVSSSNRGRQNIAFRHPYVNTLAQLTDGSDYVHDVQGFSMKRAEVIVGNVANLIGAINGTRAFTPCFSFSVTDAARWTADLGLILASKLDPHLVDLGNAAGQAARRGVGKAAAQVEDSISRINDALNVATSASFQTAATAVKARLDEARSTVAAVLKQADEVAQATQALSDLAREAANAAGRGDSRARALQERLATLLDETKATVEAARKAEEDLAAQMKTIVDLSANLAATATNDAESAAAAALKVPVSGAGELLAITAEQTGRALGYTATLVSKGAAAVVFGVLGEVGGLLFDTFAGGDMLLPVKDSDKSSTESRGVPSHEYGHFVLCNLLEAYSPSVFAQAYDEAAVLGVLGQTPDKEPVVINEAFADFMTGQLAGAVDYSVGLKGLIRPSDAALGQSHTRFCSKDNPTGNLEENVSFQKTSDFNQAVSQVATLIHDFYDGHLQFSDAPSNAAVWKPQGSIASVTLAQPSVDGSDEQINLVGLQSVISDAVHNGHYLRYTELFSALGQRAERDLNWCAACEVFRIHNIFDCEAYLGGRPPGLTCSWEPCSPPNVVMKAGVVCAPPCPPGEVFDVRKLTCVFAPPPPV